MGCRISKTSTEASHDVVRAAVATSAPLVADAVVVGPRKASSPVPAAAAPPPAPAASDPRRAAPYIFTPSVTLPLLKLSSAATSNTEHGLVPFAAFLSHAQATGGDQVLVLREALRAWAPAARVWHDLDEQPTAEGMRAGVAGAAVFVLFLSRSVLARPAVRLEVGAALSLGKPLVFVLEHDAAHGGAPDGATLLREGRAQQAQALASAGADAAAVERVRALTDAHWTALAARLEQTPPIVYQRNIERLFAETLPPLAAAIGFGARAAAAPARAPFHMRRPLKVEPGACDVLVLAAEAGADQATFLQLGLQRRCARRALVVRQMKGAGEVADAASSDASGSASVSASVNTGVSTSASASAGASACAADDATADAAVAGAARVLLVMTERFFEDVRVAAALRAALRRKVPVELVWERHYQHGGVERFEYFFGREPVHDKTGVARMPELPATPAELLPLYNNAAAVELERRAEKREPMLDALLLRLGAVRTDAIGGRLAPPPLPLGFEAGPVEENVRKIAQLLVGGQVGASVVAAGEGASASVDGAGAVGGGVAFCCSVAAASTAGASATSSIAAPSSVPPHPYRIVAAGGLGGAGKTTLATAVVLRRAEVRAAFDDVYWLTLGRATREQLLAKMRELIDEVGGGESVGAAGELKTVETATMCLRELLGARRVLVVVDDAWTRDHFAAFVGAIEDSGVTATSESNTPSVVGATAAAGGVVPASHDSASARGSSLLFTTRNLAEFRRAAEPAAVRALPANAWPHLGHCAAVDAVALAPEPAHAFLAASAGIAPAHAAGLDFERIFAAVGTLPLPLFIVGACARRQLEPLGRPDREAERDVVADIAGALEAGGTAGDGGEADKLPPAHGAWLESARFRAALLAQNSEAEGKYAPTFAAISLALGTLSATDVLAFASLSLFAEDTAVHEAVVAAAWRMQDAPARAHALLERLQAAGLAKLEATEGVAGSGSASTAVGAVAVMLHDLESDFASAICASQAGGAAAWHTTFLARLAHLISEDAAAEGACRPWWRLGEKKEHSAVAAFAAEHLLAHLRAAGLRNEAAALAFRLPWLQFVLRRRGVLALVDDLKRNVEGSEEKGLLVETLKLSLPGLVIGVGDEAADSLLPGQVVGRVSVELGAKWPATLGALRNECWDWRGPREWMRPVQAHFTAPGGPLKATLEGHGEQVTCSVLLSGGRVVSGSRDGTLRVWNASTGACERVLEGHAGSVDCVAVLTDDRVLSGSDDKTLRVWDVSTGLCERVLQGHSDWVFCVAVLPGGRVLSGSSDKTLRIWDVSTRMCNQVLEAHESIVRCIAVMSDGHVVSGSDDKTLRVWDTSSGACEHALQGHEGAVWCVAVLSKMHVLSGSDDKTLRMWNISTGVCERVFQGHSDWLRCMAVLPNGRVVSGSSDKTLRVWDVLSGKCERTLKGHSRGVRCVAVLSDGRVVSGSDDKTLRVWDTSSGDCEHALEGHEGAVWCVAVLPDGRILSGSADNTLREWDASSSAFDRSIEGHEFAASCVAVLPDGRVVSGSGDHTLRLWNASSGVCERVFKGHEGAVLCMAVLPDGSVVSGSWDRTLRVWGVSTGTCQRVFRGHSSWVNCVAVLSNERVVSGSSDKMLRVWDVSTSICYLILEGHKHWVTCVAVLSDGRFVSGSDDMTLRVWDGSTFACERVVQSTDADYAFLKPSGHNSHTQDAREVSLHHSGPLLSISSARIHVSEELQSSNAAYRIAGGGLEIACGTKSGRVFSMNVVAAR